MTPRLLRPAQREWQAWRLAPLVGDRRELVRTLGALDRAKREAHSEEGAVAPIMGRPMRGADGFALTALFNDVFLTGDYAVDCSTPAPTIVDCGANIGFGTLFFKLRWPAATIHCLEPNPTSYRYLVENVMTNELEGVVTANQAVWSTEGELELHVGADRGGMRASVRAERGGTRTVRVPAVRLSRVLESLGTVDLVKLDVEGAEHAVLEDLVSTRAIGIPAQYVIEYHHQLAGDPPRLSTFLAPFEQAGYRYHLTARRRRSDGFQDVIIHAVRPAAPE